MIVATAARAGTYTETLSVNPSSLVRHTIEAQVTCLETKGFSGSTGSGDFTLGAGQSALISLNHTLSLTVPGSAEEGIALVGLIDSTDTGSVNRANGVSLQRSDPCHRNHYAFQEAKR